MALGWEGTKVRLSPLEKDRHYENCVRWINDPEITAWTLIGDYPLTRLAEQEFFDRVARQPQSEVPFAIETLEAEEHIGVAGLYGVDLRHGVSQIGLFIGRQQLWGRGFGTDAVRTLTRYAFDVLGLRLLMSEALAENVASVRMHEKCGYTEYGRIPARYYKRGAHRDVITYYCARENWAPGSTGK